MEESSDPRYLEGIRWFNRGEFFEAHEVWEELWTEYRGPSRTFYQGLIQAAVCLHHFGNRNLRGAYKLFHSSRRYLEPFRPVHCGLDVDKLLREMEICCRGFAHDPESSPPTRLDPRLLPKIELQQGTDGVSPDGSQLGE